MIAMMARQLWARKGTGPRGHKLFALTIKPGSLCKRWRDRRADSTLSHKKHLRAQQKQRRMAGTKSGIARAGRAARRRLIVKRTFRQLTEQQQMNPYSANTIDALKKAYDRQLSDLKTLTGPSFKVGRETLRSDLKRLGIRTWRRQSLSELKALLADNNDTN